MRGRAERRYYIMGAPFQPAKVTQTHLAGPAVPRAGPSTELAGDHELRECVAVKTQRLKLIQDHIFAPRRAARYVAHVFVAELELFSQSIVYTALSRVREHLKRSLNTGKALRGAPLVRMGPTGRTAIGLLDFCLSGGRADAQHLVVHVTV